MRIIPLVALLSLTACETAPAAAPSVILGAAAPTQTLDAAYVDRTVAEINAARANPRAYAQKLKAFRALFNGNRVERPGQITLLTEEGLAAVDEAIAFLEAQQPLPVLGRSLPLDRAASAHAGDQRGSGAVGHTGSDGSGPADRMRRFARWTATGEAIAYGSDTPEDVIMQLIIDDGVADRGHRAILFSPGYVFVGAACDGHPQWRQVCVFDFARVD